MDSASLQRSPAITLDDTLRQIPSFSLFRRSSSLVAHPTTQGVSLRGIGPSGVSRTLVLLDGTPLNDPFGGWIYWSQLDKNILDTVEVAPGGGSSLYGSSPLGGVIQIFSRVPEENRLESGYPGRHPRNGRRKRPGKFSQGTVERVCFRQLSEYRRLLHCP